MSTCVPSGSTQILSIIDLTYWQVEYRLGDWLITIKPFTPLWHLIIFRNYFLILRLCTHDYDLGRYSEDKNFEYKPGHSVQTSV